MQELQRRQRSPRRYAWCSGLVSRLEAQPSPSQPWGSPNGHGLDEEEVIGGAGTGEEETNGVSRLGFPERRAPPPPNVSQISKISVLVQIFNTAIELPARIFSPFSLAMENF